MAVLLGPPAYSRGGDVAKRSGVTGGPGGDRLGRAFAGQRRGERLADHRAELEAVAGEAGEHPRLPERLDDEPLALGDAVEARPGLDDAIALEVDQPAPGRGH